MSTLRTLLFLGAMCAITGCSTAPHVGSWAHQDNDVYVGLELKRNGECVLVAAARVPLGNEQSGSTGGGYKCLYSVSGRTVTVSEAVFNSGLKERLGEPVIVQVAEDGASLRINLPEKVFTLYPVSSIRR